jgi:hypothetical protein
MHFLCHFKSKLELELELKFKLLCKVKNANLLAIIARDTYYI